MRFVVGCCCSAIMLGAFAFGADPPKVFITDSKSWEMSGHSGGSSGSFGGEVHGGARPQTAEIIKTFGERCPNVTINMKQDKADYVVVLEHEGGKGWVRKDNKVAVFDNHEGDSIYSHSTASLGGSVKDACAAINKHWAEKGAARAAQARSEASARQTPRSDKTPEAAGAKLQLSSVPAGADIEIDGSFVGSTPSVVVLAPGEHAISVKKPGYKTWERRIRITGGEVNLAAELEKAQ